MSFHEQKIRNLENRVNQLSQQVNRDMAQKKHTHKTVCVFKKCPKEATKSGKLLFGSLQLGGDMSLCAWNTKCPKGFKSIGTLNDGLICACDGKDCCKTQGKHGQPIEKYIKTQCHKF